MSIFAAIKSALPLRSKEAELISVVLHFRQPRRLADDAIHTAVIRAWGRDVREDLNEYVVNKPPICFLKFDGMVLHLTLGDRNYCPPQFLEQALAQFPDGKQKTVTRDHKGFLTIDLLSPKNPSGRVKHQCYQRIASLAAELIDENCMGVYIPETGHMRPHDNGLVAALRSDRPLREIEKWS